MNGSPLNFELDTGAVVSCAGESTYEAIQQHGDKLMPTNGKLRDYNKKALDVASVAMVSVNHDKQNKKLPLEVVRCYSASLIGRNWLRHIMLD